jgi:hypothetical protein
MLSGLKLRSSPATETARKDNDSRTAMLEKANADSCIPSSGKRFLYRSRSRYIEA